MLSAAQRRPRRVIVVLPAFNEAPKIGVVLERIEDAMAEAGLDYLVIVVDDGSRDATAAIVEERSTGSPILLLRHERNQGLGAAIRDGLAAAAEQSGERDVVVTMDADDTHMPALAVRMARMLAEGYDVVIASRYRPGSRTLGVPWSRRLLSRAGSLVFRLLLPIPGVRDFTCGYRAYRAPVLKAAFDRFGAGFLDQDGFQCMVDILLKLRELDLVFGEVPFVLRYDQKEGGTKMRIGATVLDTLALALRHRLSG